MTWCISKKYWQTSREFIARGQLSDYFWLTFLKKSFVVKCKILFEVAGATFHYWRRGGPGSVPPGRQKLRWDHRDLWPEGQTRLQKWLQCGAQLSLRASDRLLPAPDLHSAHPHRLLLLGQLLAGQDRDGNNQQWTLHLSSRSTQILNSMKNLMHWHNWELSH